MEEEGERRSSDVIDCANVCQSLNKPTPPPPTRPTGLCSIVRVQSGGRPSSLLLFFIAFPFSLLSLLPFVVCTLHCPMPLLPPLPFFFSPAHREPFPFGPNHQRGCRWVGGQSVLDDDDLFLKLLKCNCKKTRRGDIIAII